MSTVTLTWSPPTARADASPLPGNQIAGASIYDTGAPSPGSPIGTVTGAVGTFTTGILIPGAHSFTIVTTDINGTVSAASNAVSQTVSTLASPGTITNLTKGF